MDLERAKELINALIERAMVNESIHGVLQHLLYVGFTEKELTEEFGFSNVDVKEAANDMDYYEED